MTIVDDCLNDAPVTSSAHVSWPGRCRLRPLAWIVAMLAVLTGCDRPSLDVRTEFLTAEAEFAAADSREEYLHVAARYQQLLDAGHHSAAVYYNQALAYLEAREPARAIAALRVARRYRPRDPSIAEALQRARAASDAELGGSSSFSYIMQIQNWLSVREKCWLITGILCVTLTASVIHLARGRSSSARRAAWLGGIACLVVAVSAGFDVYRYDLRKHAVVLHEAHLRRGAAMLHEPVLPAVVETGTELVVRERRNDWARVDWPGHGAGWMPTKDLIIY